MTVSYATQKEKLSVIRCLQNKQKDYMTVPHIKQDIDLGRLVICKDDKGKVIGFIAIENKPQYVAIKRALVPNKKNHGKGVMDKLVQFVCGQDFGQPLGATPWADNEPMKRILQRNGFHYQYTFNEVWEYYERGE